MDRMIPPLLGSLRFRLTAGTLAVALSVVVGLTLLLDSAAVKRLRVGAETNLEVETDSVAAKILSCDRDCATAVDRLSRAPAIVSMDPKQQQPILWGVRQSYGDLNALKTTTPTGEVVATSDDDSTGSFDDGAWHRGGEDPNASCQTLVSSTTNMPIRVYRAPIRDAAGKTVGVISASYEPQRISLEMPSSKLGETGYRMIVDERGRVLAHRDRRLAQQFTAMDNLAPVHRVLNGEGDGLMRFQDKKGTVWLSFARQLKNGWTILSLEKEDEVLADVQRFQQYEVLVAGSACAIAALLMWLAATRLSRPIVSLAEFAGEVGKGRLDLRANEKGPGEIGRLARSLNAMLVELERGYREIEAEVKARTQALQLRNAELTQLSEKSRKEAQWKDEFLANMGHEIRTPLTAILGYAELLVDLQMSDEERSKALQSIQYNGEHLLNIINDVLDVAKLDARKMEVQNSEFPVVTLINEVVTLMKSKAMAKGITLEVQFAGDLPDVVNTDPTRLRQILLNLVGNAVKYTQQGGVKIVTRVLQSDDCSDDYIQFEIIDTGIGMTDEHLAKLFQPFSQATASIATEYGGSGLGLVISQGLARLLGGDITVKSTFGEGSTFTVWVKIAQVSGRRMSRATDALSDSVAAIPFLEDKHADSLTGVRLLLADDNADNRALLCQILQSAGAEVITADAGRRACHAAMEAFQDGKAFDVVVLDMQMSDMDGAATTARLRQLGYPNPVLVLSSTTTEAAEERCLKAGCNEYVRKPIAREKLISRLAHLAGRKSSGSEDAWFGNVA